ncbi:MAG: glycosyltransferase family 4 protein [Saprospiraceae bacterium]|nr:glycosyltransferase family 4 protein [Saprospiraceae bacterium]
MSESPLNIGFDAKRLFLNNSGLGNYARTLVNGLVAAQNELTCHLYTPDTGDRADCQVYLQGPPFEVHTPSRGMPGTIWRSVGIPNALERHGVTLYHGLSNELPIGLKKIGVRSVATIHDLIYRHYPAHYSRMDRVIYNGKTKYASENADLIVAISECTKQDILDAYKVDEDRVTVAYQSCDPIFYETVSETEGIEIRNRLALPGEYLLYVGSVNERKNLLMLVKAMELLPDELRLPLVVVGHGGSYLRKVNRYLDSRKLSRFVYFRPGVASADLPAIYQGAAVFCYPSLYEGFGIPILEALASGAPVLTSHRSSMPEAGGPGSQYIDPENAEEIADSLRRILESDTLRQSMATMGREHADTFRLSNTSAKLWDCYKRVLGQ